MKGQIKVEFVLGVVVFAVIIFYVSSQINTAFLSTSSDSRLDVLKSRTITLLNIIVKNNDTGLAIERGNLNKTKIVQWKDNKCQNLKTYNLGGYRLTIMEEGQDTPLLFCGYVGLGGLNTHVIRAVKITNDTSGLVTYASVTLELW